jgi:hypothetical protein
MSGNVGMRNMEGCAATWKLKDWMKCNWTAHFRSELDFLGTSQASVVLILFTAIKFNSWKQSLVNCMMSSIIILLERLLKSVESPQLPLYLCMYVCVSLCLSVSVKEMADLLMNLHEVWYFGLSLIFIEPSNSVIKIRRK